VVLAAAAAAAVSTINRSGYVCELWFCKNGCQMITVEHVVLQQSFHFIFAKILISLNNSFTFA